MVLHCPRAAIRDRVHYGTRRRGRIVHRRPAAAVSPGQAARARSLPPALPVGPIGWARLRPVSAPDPQLLHLAPARAGAEIRTPALPRSPARKLEARAVRALVGPPPYVLRPRAPHHRARDHRRLRLVDPVARVIAI